MADVNTTQAIILRLAMQGLPLPHDAASDKALQLVSPVLAHSRELSRRLADRPCAADRRIQEFLDSYLADATVRPQLPRRTLVLDQPGLARELALPRDADEFSSGLLSSYRLANGVLHNPRSDRRTTQGIFHIAEGGLPIPADKIAVPKHTFALMLGYASRRPTRLLLPFTASRRPGGVFCVVAAAAAGRARRAGALAREDHGDRFFAPGTLVTTWTSSKASSATAATLPARERRRPRPNTGPATPAA